MEAGEQWHNSNVSTEYSELRQLTQGEHCIKLVFFECWQWFTSKILAGVIDETWELE